MTRFFLAADPRLLALVLALFFVPTAEGEVVLLHNGSLLEGTIRRTADEIIVENNGNAIRLRPREVAHVADSALAVYEWRRTRGSGDLADRLGLAEWAIRSRLFPQASRELLDARQLSPGNRRLALLERRLDELLRRPDPDSVPKANPASTTAQSEAADTIADSEPQEQPLPNLPHGALEQFTRRIQPLLVNSCATAGCHSGGETDPFPLDPSWRHGYGDARSTHQNLRTTLAALDFGSPEASPLLAAARGPHAGVTPLVGSRRDEMLQRLSAWAARVAMVNAEEISPPPTVFVDANGAEPILATEPATRIDYGVVTASYDAPAMPLKRGLQSVQIGPRDEFDPDVFNRKHRRPQDDLPAGVSGR